eukprot:NODE_146_length_15710_cov_0.617385.p1 type:complete len:369 gc:universal NODE_146_length_15710_cov_0.617385:12788-13894(+)
MDYFLVCLSGGPCAGKSSVQAILADVLENSGYKVYKLPEAATTLFNCGVNFMDLSEDQRYLFQKHIIRFMMSLEDPFIDLCKSNAKKGIKSALITDRGSMDPSAYISRDLWLKMLSELNLNEVELRDCRYDIVIHMVSAADGAEKFYNLATNTVRTEGIELAKELDEKIRNAWIGHPYLSIIDNSTGFDEKCNRVVQAVLKRIGLVDKRFGSGIKKRKYLIAPEFQFTGKFPVGFRDFSVEHLYLTSEKDQYRIRKRWDDKGIFYSLTIRKSLFDQKIEERRVLTAREYENLFSQKDQNRHTILKTRRCFLYHSHYFHLDYYEQPHNGLMLLEAYIEDSQAKVLPDFLPIVKEVTEDDSFSMFNLSLK